MSVVRKWSENAARMHLELSDKGNSFLFAITAQQAHAGLINAPPTGLSDLDAYCGSGDMTTPERASCESAF
jgi:hypothetical protein